MTFKNRVVRGVAGVGALVAGGAQAAVPAEVTTAITGGGADAVLIAAACLAAYAGFKLFNWARQVLR